MEASASFVSVRMETYIIFSRSIKMREAFFIQGSGTCYRSSKITSRRLSSVMIAVERVVVVEENLIAESMIVEFSRSRETVSCAVVVP